MAGGLVKCPVMGTAHPLTIGGDDTQHSSFSGKNLPAPFPVQSFQCLAVDTQKNVPDGRIGWNGKMMTKKSFDLSLPRTHPFGDISEAIRSGKNRHQRQQQYLPWVIPGDLHFSVIRQCLKTFYQATHHTLLLSIVSGGILTYS